MGATEIEKNYRENVLITDDLYKNWEEEIMKPKDPYWDDVF